MTRIIAIAALLLALVAPARAESTATGCAEVCAEVCKNALVDSCQDFVCPEIPDCNVSCPEIPACPAPPECPSVTDIYSVFVHNDFARKYNICKVKKNGDRRCKKWYIVDASRSGQ